MYRRVLVALSLGPACAGTVRYAHDLTRAWGGALTLLHVLPKGAEEPPARDQLLRLGTGARHPPEVLIHPQGQHGVAEVILQAARQVRAEVLMLGAVGREGGQALGRVAREVTYQATVPVHVVPPNLAEKGSATARWLDGAQNVG